MTGKQCRGLWLIGVVLGLSSSGPPLSAQQPLLDRAAGLFAVVNGRLEPLEIRRADIEVEIAAGQARTTTTLVFTNPHRLELEGELVFPVPHGAAVSGFGLDVQGEIVDAVAVERRQARAAYDAQLRPANPIDPGLFEWVRGNVFRMRVFPIPPLGERSVRVRYLTALAPASDARGVHALHLPIATDVLRPARQINLSVTSVGDTVPSESNGRLRFTPREGRQVASARFDGLQLPDALTVRVPIVESGSAAISVLEDGSRYFLVDDFPLVPEPLPDPRPRRIGVVWDASLSRTTANTDREIGIVERWLSQVGEADVDLVVLREVAEPTRRFAIRNRDAGALVAALRAVAYDGGTRLDLLPPCDGCAFQVLFTDGQTLFDETLPRLDNRPPLRVISNAPPGRRGFLEEASRATGGSYLDAAVNDADIVAALARPRWLLLSVRAEGGEVADLEVADADASSGRVTVSGRLLTPSAYLVLEYGFEPRRPLARRAIGLPANDDGDLAAMTWAAWRTSRLARLPRVNRPELLRLGLAFSLATPATSLLVLETARQHLASGIEPPRSRPALYDEFQQRRSEWDAWRANGAVCGQRDRLATFSEGWRDHRLEASGQEIPSSDFAPPPMGKGGGTIVGRVRTEDGEVFGGGEVEIRDACTFASRTVPVDRDGRYEARDLPAANYLVRAQVIGYEGEPRQTPVRGEDRRTVDVRLLTACLCERVFVTDYDGSPGDQQEDDARPDTAIELPPWAAARPYLAALTTAAPADRYRTYLTERAAHSRSPGFYFDVAEVFLAGGDRLLARRMWLNAIELDPGNVRLVRAAAHRFLASGDVDFAIRLFESVTSLVPLNPIARHDLALALIERADRRRISRQRVDPIVLADYRAAFALYRAVLEGRWEGWFEEVHVAAVTNMNRIRTILRRNRIALDGEFALAPGLAQALEADLRVVLTWDDDAVELQLLVYEPAAKVSGVDGSVDLDSNGYGPAEFVAQQVQRGTYRLSVFYRDRDGRMQLGPTLARAIIYTDFGRPTERVRYESVRLIREDEDYPLATVRR